ncbi:MAG: Bud site selection protein 6 [Caeruleum heppii]|nr:MAG: Bud site selection protein 6 [Caeruleum heppii]
MQAPQTSQRSTQRRSPNVDPDLPALPASGPATGSVSGQNPPSSRNTSNPATRSQPSRRTNPSQQLSQIEKSVTHLLVATKQLLETLTQWSRHNATEAEVSDVYVRLGYEFNIASRAFNAIGVDTADLGNVPDLLRSILEDTLSQEASPASLDRYLPRIRDIIINLLHGLKRKQQKLRQRQAREEQPSNGGPYRQHSLSSTGSGDLDHGQTSEEPSARHPTPGQPGQTIGRTSSRENNLYEDTAVPPRTTSAHGGRASPMRQDSGTHVASRLRDSPSSRSQQQAHQPSSSSSLLANNNSHNASNLNPTYANGEAMTHQRGPPSREMTPAFPPPPPEPPKQQDALAALQRGGDLERRASRRYSAYQISKHLGASPLTMPTLPPAQSSPIPNRGRDVRESMNAVRNRGSVLHTRQRSNNAPMTDQLQGGPHELSDRGGTHPGSGGRQIEADSGTDGVTLSDQRMPAVLPDGEAQQPQMGGQLPTAPPGPEVESAGLGEQRRMNARRPQESISGVEKSLETQIHTRPEAAESGQLETDQVSITGKELTLFLQYKSKIKKFVLPDGYNELSVARLQLAFIEKFAWNTHSNGIDLPEIYIQDPVSGVRHELEDLSDIKDRSVLVLNVEVLDEVKKHIDEGLGGLRRMVEGVRSVVDGQHSAMQRVVDRQQDTAKEMARLAAAPAPTPTRLSRVEPPTPNGVRSPIWTADKADQLGEVQSLRRDLAVMRQTYSNFVSDVRGSMSDIRSKASSVKTVAIKAAIPTLDGETGRAYVNKGKKEVSNVSDGLVNKVDDLQDIVEDLRKDVVTRGVRPLPRQLETVGRDISTATAELKKMQEFLRREKPKWSKIWERELQVVCDDRDLLTMQEALAADLQDDLDNAAQTFALVEEATKEQMKDGQVSATRSASRSLNAIAVNSAGDPHTAKEGVLGEVRALQPNHENRLEAIERAEKARQRELESRRGGEFQKELGSFVEEGRLKKSGGVEEAERLRKSKDERARKEVWERTQARAKGKAAEGATPSSAPLGGAADGPTATGGSGDGATAQSGQYTDAEEQKGEDGTPTRGWLPAIFGNKSPTA